VVRMNFSRLFIGAVLVLALLAAMPEPQIINPPSKVSSLIATGIVDGQAPITITTSASCTLGTASGCNATAYQSGYTFNQEGTAAAAVTYTLPPAAAGEQYCVQNSNNGSAPDTGVLKVQTSASGQSIIFAGTVGGSAGYLQSGGAAGDAACVVAISSMQWSAYVQSGTWSVH
jgi:hypothetical protein